MRLQPSEQPLLDENVELPALAVAPGPPHPRGGRGSFSSSYSSGVDGTDSSCSFSSSRIFDESGGQEVDLDELSSESSRGDYALLSMPVESVKRLVATSTIISRSTGSRIVDRQVDTQDSSIGQAARYPGIAGALRELREGRVAIDNVEDDDEGVLFQEERQEPGSVELRKLILRLSTRRDLLVLAMGLFAALIHGGLWSLLALTRSVIYYQAWQQ
ncbi:ABC transporter B member 10 [Phytophthora boehmeriae]|uniref:ABC transporter B member 10 n=1 Tax=Phytophthora boehmeriae TaxID=109152 RepID=A0A8T1VDD0_9STRA|nr:ABC transporter B member 10 [Phytophthora boehmeriae]